MPSVIVVSTGDELLFGTTVNTNSSFISNIFFGTNFKVIKHITIGDEINTIISAVKNSIDEAEIIIVTGGLGPTDDDNTVEAVSRIFNKNVVVDEASNKHIIQYFESMNFISNSMDVKMSTVPENSIVINNMTGLAPGFMIKENERIVIALPGVPSEAENMMTESVLPLLEKEYSFTREMNLVYRMSGIRESEINMMVRELRLPDYLKIGITVKYGVCDLVITNIGNNLIQKEEIDILINEKFSKYIFNYNAVSPEQELVLLLKEKCLTIATAESCTGGLVAKRITDIPGSSEVYKGSIIAYSNDIKKSFLDVSDETLKLHGAVSENTAAEMALAIKKKFGTDLSISTTGIAGPDGGSEIKPVGTVCFGIQVNEHLHTFTRVINGNRDRVRIFASLYAINYLRDFLKSLD